MVSVFKALADPARRKLLDALHQHGGQTLSELHGQMPTSRQAVMKHIAVLEAAKLVSASRWGRYKVHYIKRAPLRNLGSRWLDGKSVQTGGTAGKSDFVYAIVVQSPPRRVWQALTDPAMTRQYWHRAAIESDWRAGSQVLLKKDDGSYVGGKLLEYSRPKRLSYEFSRSGERRKKPVEVTFDLIPVGGNTKLVVTSCNLLEVDLSDNPHVLFGLNNGWPMFMSSLKSLLETGRPITLEEECI
jgi:uncharacterized protein YndB with AHSA1/START domain